MPEVTSLEGLVPTNLSVWANTEHIPGVAITADHRVRMSVLCLLQSICCMRRD